MFANVAALSSSDARSGRRRLVNFTASVAEADNRLQRLKISDLSATGCRLQNVHGLSAETDLWIKFEGLLPLRARVIWENGGEAGCEFNEPLSEGDLSCLLPPAGAKVLRKRLFTNPVHLTGGYLDSVP